MGRIDNYLYTLPKAKMKCWRQYNNLPEYIDASYVGYTGVKGIKFPTGKGKFYYPEISNDVRLYEEEIFQQLHDIKQTPFGYIKALFKMLNNLSTGESWDSKFNWQFPGRDEKGRVQYARYKEKILSTNDLSNQIYAHICAFMQIPKPIAQLMAKLDACGALEIFTKGKFPNKKLLNFQDTPSDQLAIAEGYKNFNINEYRIKK